MPGTVKSELLPDADRLHKCDSQEKVCEMQHLPLDKSHFITVYRIPGGIICFCIAAVLTKLLQKIPIIN